MFKNNKDTSKYDPFHESGPLTGIPLIIGLSSPLLAIIGAGIIIGSWNNWYSEYKYTPETRTQKYSRSYSFLVKTLTDTTYDFPSHKERLEITNMIGIPADTSLLRKASLNQIIKWAKAYGEVEEHWVGEITNERISAYLAKK